MDQEKFVNQYIELLNATVTEAINKNLVIQSQKLVLEKELEEVRSTIKNHEDAAKKIGADKDREIANLKNELNASRKETAIAGNEREELRKNIQHVETFKAELVKTRSRITELEQSVSEKDKVIGGLQDELNKKEDLITNLLAEKNKPVDVGDTWVKKTPAKKKIIKEETVKDAGKF
jgi:chromosome segregation ATPase